MHKCFSSIYIFFFILVSCAKFETDWNNFKKKIQGAFINLGNKSQKVKFQKPWVPFICSGVCKNCLGTQLKKQALTISHCKKNAKNPFPLSTVHFLFKIRLTSNQVLCLHLLNIGFILSPNSSDESKPSQLEPQLELKDFQLGSDCDLFHFSLKSKIGRKRAEI